MAFTTRLDFELRARRRLLPIDFAATKAVRTDFDLTPGFAQPTIDPVRAAVLVGLIDHGDELGVLLTLRPDTMTRHAGQIAFPGGRIDPEDASPLAAALREAEEEVGLDPEGVDIVGQGDPYLTSTGYLVSPFIGIIRADFVPRPDPREVADVFETPLSFLMRPENHERHTRRVGEIERAYFAMPYDGRYIWGATAGMVKALYDRLYGIHAADLRGDGEV